MITFLKSQPPPPCLAIEKEKNNGNYNCGSVVERLNEDFKNKCYICEYHEHTNFNTEHFKPHKGDKELKFDWNNLFQVCGHCNNIKGARFDLILNCTLSEHRVADCIMYETETKDLRLSVKLSAVRDGDIVHNKLVQNTVDLLREVYNGTTPQKKIGSANMRKALTRELSNFRHSLERFFECKDEDEKSDHQKNIQMHLKNSSAFTAFKRWIIKNNAEYSAEFIHYFE